MDRADAKTWDTLARRYGAQERLELRAIDTALALAAPTAGERLVDLGTGTGLVLRRLATLSEHPRAAVGIDRSAGMLARAGRLPAGCSVLRADARAVPLPDGWADVVCCAYLLHLLEPQERRDVLAEAHRLLRERPAARLVVVTMWIDESRPLGRLTGRALGLAADARPAAWGGLRPLDPTQDVVAAGFEVTRRIALSRGGYPSLVVETRPSLGDP